MVLQEGEHSNVLLDDQDITEGLQEDELSVLIHLFSGKAFNFEGFKTAMGRAWRCGSFSIQRVDEQYYKIFFETGESVNFALKYRPWNFENCLVLARPRITIPTNPIHGLDVEFL